MPVPYLHGLLLSSLIMRYNSRKTAFCGLTGALCAAMLMMGGLFPFATYACPAAAACLLLPVAYEYKQKTAFVLYFAVSLLALFIVADKELVFMFIFIFGPYTAAKFSFDRIKPAPLRLTLKIAFFNAAVIFSYGILLFVFPIQILVQEFDSYGLPFVAVMLVMFNAVFLLYDKAVEKLLIIYVIRFRKMFFKK